MNLAKGLKAAAQSDGWLELARLPCSALRREALVRAFGALEDALDIRFERRTAGRIAEQVRRLLYAFLCSVDPDLRRAVKTAFKPRLTLSKTTPRPLISSMPGSASDGTPRPPIEAISHRTLQDLREKRLLTLMDDMRKIENACEAEFMAHEDFCRRFEAVERAELPPHIRLALSQAIAESSASINWEVVASLRNVGCTGMHLASIYWEMADKAKAGISDSELPLRMRNPSWIAEGLRLEGSISNVPDDPFSYYLYGNAYTRTACMLALCVHTGWNADAVTNLTDKNVLGEIPPYTLQSYKGKTGKHTSVSIVEKSNALAARALQLLRARLFWLKAFKLVRKDDDRLWINPGRHVDPARELRQYVGIRAELKRFQEKYHLPNFSHDQVRTQFIGLSSVRDVDLGFTQDVADHQSLDTTARYLQQELLASLNQAINFEFQRRLEASVDYEGKLKASPGRRDFKQSILYPIGDGSSCVDPGRPPEPAYLVAGFCKGDHCHVGESGCPNRRIVLNERRVTENVHQLHFYRAHWRALMDAYPENFRKYHLPAMIFAVMLDAVISAGPLAAIRAAELAKLLSSEGQQWKES
ncbi:MULTISPECIES: hypothetical protein [unclassified Roseateles]|uniref:hypothetical protein n=1 Tax=unclassified Roseateles TaxID=2626991 RepID=UPI0012E378FC|nr:MULTISPECIES: hypothetical protein [unclassified Roseateles]